MNPVVKVAWWLAILLGWGTFILWRATIRLNRIFRKVGL